MTSDAFSTLEGPGGKRSVSGYINNIENETVLACANLRPIADVI